MTRLFIDTNVLLDVVLRRGQFVQESARVIDLGMRNKTQLVTTALTFATCVYVSRKSLGYDTSIECMKVLEKYFDIAPMNDIQVHEALYANMPDFEDMLQYHAALASGCDVIITRNVKHFPQQLIPVMAPDECVKRIK